MCALGGLLAAAWVDADARFDRLVPPGALVEPLAGAFGFTEGPLWNAARQELLFSDIPADRIVRWAEWPGGPTLGTWRSPSGRSNGLTLDAAGRLIVCEHANRRVSRIAPDGSGSMVADRFRGKRLNSPNDAVVRSDGTIYFTDPPYGVEPQARELEFSGVYRVPAGGGPAAPPPPAGGAPPPPGRGRRGVGGGVEGHPPPGGPAPSTVEGPLLVSSEFKMPNGLAFSPDERTLYVNDTEGGVIRAFEVAQDGSTKPPRAFATITSPDGMKVDVEGNVWCTSAEGVEVFDPAGARRGVVRFPEQPANCAFGGKDRKTLYVTARTGLYRIRVGVAGLPAGPR